MLMTMPEGSNYGECGQHLLLQYAACKFAYAITKRRVAHKLANLDLRVAPVIPDESARPLARLR